MTLNKILNTNVLKFKQKFACNTKIEKNIYVCNKLDFSQLNLKQLHKVELNCTRNAISNV